MKSFTSGLLLWMVFFPAFSQEAGNFDLKYQRCEWTVDPNVAELSGKITYYFTGVQNDVREVSFNLSPGMTIDAVERNNASLSYSRSDNVIRIDLPEAVSTERSDSLSISYHGVPDPTGFGSYVRSQHNGVPIVWTLSEPYGAEDWFPCKNDLTDKVDSIDIFVTAPDGNRVASNGVLVSVTPTTADRNIHHWKMRYPVAAYLIAIAVTNYAVYSDWYNRSDADKLEILNYVYPERLETRKTETPAIIPILQFFEEKFGRYPFSDEKYGHAEFGWGGGMENQTMSFMVNFGYELMAHELAHQWFGDMITCGSWHDIWLNEGFATYATALFQEKTYPADWENWKISRINDVTSVPDGSVYRYDISSNSVIFPNRYTYSKGALVLHMLRFVLGDEQFFDALWNYAHDPTLQFNFAFTADLRNHFEAVSGKDLSEFFDTWIYKEGYPVYDISVNQTSLDNASVTIRQTPSHASVSCFKMPLPFKFFGTENESSEFVFYNDLPEQSFTFDPGFQISNVVFDPDKWILCKSQLALTTGIDVVDNDLILNVLPNPAQDFVTVNVKPGISASWVLSDVSGKTLKTGGPVPENEFVIDLSGFYPGVYLITFLTDAGKITKKLMIAKK
ncbi:MAG: T9SS type A sorting domain-containing protein [Candidatus Azobacteroides sp.]|nr:T9SS type A sorting domain-containing protein [Candidatus Azobacteroides sp.]